ncbi:MAG: prepilin peptidase [Planctomycetes bacterium]|nr:prepilin peptidase [Planctomycetota bacterium]
MSGLVVFVAAVALFTGVAAVLDIRMHRIPNYLTVPTAVLGLIYHTVAPGGWGLAASLGGLALGFSLLLLPWLMGGGGMGDVKLLAALGAWLGWKLILVAFATSLVFGSAIAMGVLIYNVLTRGVTVAGKKFIGKRQSRDRQGRKRRPARVLPFAVPVAMSTWALLAWLVTQGF